MHVQKLRLFQNPAIYYQHYYENDVIIPVNLFSGRVSTLSVLEIYCLISKISIG